MKQRLKGERASTAHRLAPGVAILGAALSLATLPACGGSNQPTGSLYVTVLDKSMSPVADAEVTTDPATQSLVTDALGTVFFPKVPAVGYAVTASHPTAGSGRATAQVVANEVADAVITVTRPPVGGGDGGQAGGPGAGGGGVGTGGLPGSGGVAGAGAGGGAGALGTGGGLGTGGVGGGPGVGGDGGESGGTGGVAATSLRPRHGRRSPPGELVAPARKLSASVEVLGRAGLRPFPCDLTRPRPRSQRSPSTALAGYYGR